MTPRRLTTEELEKLRRKWLHDGPAILFVTKDIWALLFHIEAVDGELAECYRLTGADPDGNEDWRLAPHAVEEVKRLRRESDEAKAENARLRAEVEESRKHLEFSEDSASYESSSVRSLSATLATVVEGIHLAIAYLQQGKTEKTLTTLHRANSVCISSAPVKAVRELEKALRECRQWIEPVVQGFGLNPQTHVIIERIDTILARWRQVTGDK